MRSIVSRIVVCMARHFHRAVSCRMLLHSSGFARRICSGLSPIHQANASSWSCPSDFPLAYAQSSRSPTYTRRSRGASEPRNSLPRRIPRRRGISHTLSRPLIQYHTKGGVYNGLDNGTAKTLRLAREVKKQVYGQEEAYQRGCLSLGQ